MHPAFSILVFTTASGAGYGLLCLLGLAGGLQLVPPVRWLGLVALGVALALVTAGLLASTFHLRHPERAWRALSQWRSSWLSREGVAALATFLPTGLFAIGWVGLEDTGGLWALFAFLTAAGALTTVYCTGQIYGSLATIRQWHHPLVVPAYLALALATGSLWLAALLRLFDWPAAWPPALALASLALAWGLKLIYWRQIHGEGGDGGDGGERPSPESATGLGRFGRVRPLDPPHTESNYLMEEMGYRMARKHAERLRRLAVLFGAGVPAAGMILLFAVGGFLGVLIAVLAAFSGLLGAFIERWLFFAEARHTVMLYYPDRVT